MRGAVVLLLATLSGGHITPMPAQGAAAPFPIVIRYGVLLERGTDTLPIVAAWARWGCERVFLAPPIAAVRCPLSRQDSLKALPGVRGIEWDRADSVTSVAQVVPWNLTMIGADSAWNRGITGAGVVVGIMDSGILGTHPDLNVIGGRNFSSFGGPEDWGDTHTICKGHGTHVAGSVGSARHGVAPGVGLLALKVFEPMQDGTKCLAWTSTQIAAMYWAIEQGARAVNISIGGTYTATYAGAIVAGVQAGMLTVGAAGNSDLYVYFPGAHPQAIAVAALTSSGARASYSNQGPEVDFSAPGSGITSSMPSGGTGGKSGTSMASPHVAGVVALLEQVRPGLSRDSVYALLKASAVDVGPVGFDNGTGWGRVDVPRLLRLVIPRAPVISPPDPTPVGVTQCVAVASGAPWTATTAAPSLAVWQTPDGALCWRGDVAGSFTIRLRST